ncbi:MAG: beta-lactamase family protein, partial [Lachnospiraceae bacterium]|nr:beta-lactamase family protein [Lachnospiraceae bacterium]
MKKKKIVKICSALVLGSVITCSVSGVLHNGKETVTCKAEENERTVETEDAGVSKESENTQENYLNIGSVSKVYPVTAVMQLHEKGLVDLDKPVTEYIPDFKMADERYKDITVRMLMNHTSGLMGSNYGGSFLLDETDSDYHDGFLEHLSSQSLKADPGAFNCYCNDGFTLLEILTERVSGKTFTQYLEENICKPLSLDHTKTLWNVDMEKHEPVYIRDNLKIANECPQLIGAGGIMADAADVSAFGSAFFTGNNVLISELSKKEMATNNRAGESRENFGLGWDSVGKKDYEDAGVTVLSKGGDTMFQHGSLVVAPDEKISVAVLSGGGDSGLDESIALKLMDIALADQGISVAHPEEEKPQLVDRVPEEYLSYAGVYADMQKTIRISFPDECYMLVTSLTSDPEFEEQYMAAKDGSFVKMDGDVASGKAILSQPLQSLTFEEHDGQVYLAEPNMGLIMYQISDTDVDEKTQSAWDERSGSRYYCVSGLASDIFYLIENHSLTLQTNEAAKGFVNGYVMQDENHAGYETILPGTASRDLSNLSMETIDGKEYLNMDEIGYRYISEKSIPTWTEDIKNVELTTGEASWYKLEDVKDVTLCL